MTYRLHCECGRELLVDLHQAGSEVPCECGRSVLVPSRRALMADPTLTEDAVQDNMEEANPAVIWARRFRAMGAAILLIALVGALILYFTRPQMPTIIGWNPANTLRFFRVLEAGIDAPLFNIEANYLKRRQFHDAMLRVDLLLGILGFVLAGAASLAIWFEQHSPVPDDEQAAEEQESIEEPEKT